MGANHRQPNYQDFLEQPLVEEHNCSSKRTPACSRARLLNKH
ncbi:hypothetical protein VCHA39O224_10194 [Vibrio chagasii]|nr:hypothetical protein VCHA39O224_10194 [Vibrio chagasii]